jgi:hypothetical protein
MMSKTRLITLILVAFVLLLPSLTKADLWKRSSVWFGVQDGPQDGSGYSWKDPGFDDSSWSAITLPDDGQDSSADDRYYRAHFTWDGNSPMSVEFSSDDGLAIYVNGTLLGSWGNGWRLPGCVNVVPTCTGPFVPKQTIPASLLKMGDNVIAIDLWNGAIACCYYLDVSLWEETGISASPPILDFGNVLVGSTSTPQTLTISNTGTADLHISGIALSDTTNYSLDINAGSNPCGSTNPTIASNSSCTVTVTFNPSSEGTKVANLRISSDSPYSPTLDVPLSGNGVIPPFIIDVKANGSDGPITITTSDMLTVTVSLSPASQMGKIANWYVVAYTPLSAGWYHYEHATHSWKPGFALTARTSLRDISDTILLQRSGLPAGEYTFFFHIGLDTGQLFSDSMKVTVN